MESLRSLVENKVVAIVGPAKYMSGSNYGAEIDSHDLVVRINRGIESTKKYPRDIGKRTEILYSCLIERAQQAGKIDPQSLKGSYGVKHIVAPPVSDMKGFSNGTRYHSLVKKETIKALSSLFQMSIIDQDLNNEIAKEIKCKPNTGFLAIYHLLSMNPKSLKVYGFSFYLDGFIPGQKSGVENEKKCTEQEFADMAFNSKRHVQVDMWRYAKRTLVNDPRIRLDPVLKEILNMKEFSRKAFLGIVN